MCALVCTLFCMHLVNSCMIHDFPSCKPGCLMSDGLCNQKNELIYPDCNQISGNIYRVNGNCYKAITNCSGCLEKMVLSSDYNYNGNLTVVSCDECASAPTYSINTPTLSPTQQKCNTNSLLNRYLPIPSLTNLKFDEITTENFSDYSMRVGWIRMLSCKEGNGNGDAFIYWMYGENITLTELITSTISKQLEFSQYLDNVLPYAISIKFVPPGGKTNIHYNNLAVMAKPCSNVIYSLNNGYVLSWTVNVTDHDDSIIGNADLNNWIGSHNAKTRLVNYNYEYFQYSKPSEIKNNLYYAHYNARGIHVDTGQCYWDFGDIFNIPFEAYIGFDVDKTLYCDFDQFDDDFGKFTNYTKHTIDDLITDNIIITNEEHMNLYFIVLNISNVNISCGGYVDSVEISDNNHYREDWYGYTQHVNGCGIYEFAVIDDQTFTLPISMRITRTYNDIDINEIIVSDAVIKSLDAFNQYDFGSNLCSIISQQDPILKDTNESWSLYLFLISVSTITGCIVCIVFIFYRKRIKNQESQILTGDISNALVVIIAIGDYNYKGHIIDDMLQNAYFRDIPVDTDVENLKKLFRMLKYDVISKESKLCWTQDEVIQFLKEAGTKLFDANNEIIYDGLIVCITAHGIEDHIITSDYKAIRKTVFHRVFSIHYPKAREIPRIFLFDACDGSAQRHRAETLTSLLVSNEKSKYFGLEQLEVNQQTAIHNAWTTENKNPDFKLIEVHAANTGFQAKLDVRFGSYLLYEFTERMINCIENNQHVTLGRLFDNIQNDLHDKGKQQIVKTFNNDTSYLQLKINKNQRSAVQETNAIQPPSIIDIDDNSVSEDKTVYQTFRVESTAL